MGHIISQAKATPTSASSLAGKALPSAALAGSATATGVAFKNANSEDIFLPLPGPDHLTNRKFTIKAWGRVGIGATARDFTAGLYFGRTNGTRTLIDASVIGEVPASTSTTWQLECQLVWSATSGTFIGVMKGNIGLVFVASNVTAEVTADFDDRSTAQGFILTGLTEATITATDLAYLDGFQMEID